MSVVRSFERDGQRIEIPADADIASERRCDGCGQFVADDEAATIGVSVYLPDGTEHALRFDAHPAHIDRLSLAAAASGG
jgi:hypothetical protein